jgi:hypothetical protein
LIEGGPAVSIGYNFGGGTSTDPLWGGYLNFLVKTLGGGTLGFSPKPGKYYCWSSLLQLILLLLVLGLVVRGLNLVRRIILDGQQPMSLDIFLI